jgi:hypothetical protein
MDKLDTSRSVQETPPGLSAQLEIAVVDLSEQMTIGTDGGTVCLTRANLDLGEFCLVFSNIYAEF